MVLTKVKREIPLLFFLVTLNYILHTVDGIADLMISKNEINKS